MSETFNNLPKTAAGLHRAVSQVVRKTAFDIQADAASRAPVDTGFLRNSVYVTTSRSSGYSKAKTSARRRSKNLMYDLLLPMVDPPGDDLTAIVAVGAAYGIYVEYGTVNTPAQPFLTPAAQHGQATLNAVLSRIASQLGTDVMGFVEVDEE